MAFNALSFKDEQASDLAHKSSVFEVKELTEDGTLEGYGSVFGQLDDGSDIVAKGAFKKSLKTIKPKMLYQHDPHTPIGVWEEAKEDDKGLFLKGRIVREAHKGAEAYALLKAGAIDGLSIGYRTIRAERDERTGVRTIKELELWEVSVVTFPMLVAARVSGVKRNWTERSIERLLREGGLPNELAKNIVLHGAKAALDMSGVPRGVGDGEVLDAIKRLTHRIERK